MTVTSSYSIDGLNSPSLIYSYGEQSTYSTITSLAHGGYAALAVDADGYDDLTIYIANGNSTGGNYETRFTNAKLTALANGNVLMVGTVAGGGLEYRIFDSAGNGVGFGALARDTSADQVSIVATADGGFTIAERSGTATTGIGVIHYNASGLALTSHFELSSGGVWQHPSIARLVNGGYAVAWDSTSGGNTAVWYEILNDDLTVHLQPTILDNDSTTNKAPSVTALPTGYFSISYEDNSYSSNGQSDITQHILNVNGGNLATLQLEAMSGTDSQASAATLSNGMVVTTYTDAFSATDNDIAAAIYDPATFSIAVPGQRLPLLASTNGENNATVVALANNQFAVSYTYVNGGSSTSKIATYELVHAITGDSSDNVIVGDSGKDIVYGMAGNDTITPGDGADNDVFGGVGRDTVILSGALNAYTVTRNGLITTVVRSDGGTDTLNSIEKLHFSNGNLFTPPEVRDLNGSGYSTMVLQNSDGSIRVWTINSDGSLGSSDKTSKTPASTWHVVGSGQFNVAADQFDDLLLQNSNGNLQVWEMDGHAVNSITSIGALNTGWQAVTTGDFDGDGNADIVVENGSTVRIWMMNGVTPTAKVDISNAGYQVIDTGDFNGDGKSDLLVEKSNQLYVWLMNGTTRTESDKVGSVLANGWQAVSSGDFDGDGKSDILLWNSTTGGVMVKEMSGGSVLASATVGTIGLAYHATGTGDFNGDGKSDIVFQNSSGRVQDWLMNGTTVTSQVTLTRPGTGWSLVAGTGG